MLDLSLIDPQPPGFWLLCEVPYRETGSPALCFSCARQCFENLVRNRCGVCDRPFEGDEQECRNIICRNPRWFTWNYAVAMRSGVLQKANQSVQIRYRRTGTYIRSVLVGFFEEETDFFREF